MIIINFLIILIIFAFWIANELENLVKKIGTPEDSEPLRDR